MGNQKSSKLDTAKIREWLSETGGYGIVDPEHFRRMGFPEETLKDLTQTFSSDPELGKYAANRNDGQPGDVTGIAEFDAIHALAGMLGVTLHSPFYGRGKNFRHQVGQLLEELS